ncbi:hypothetical protein K438DRAFT_1784175 [Mycena galopus ATCC 62051]|nr:hypothetical protein K438DRAFT_1784175 [Mycena galopus ATCC 62051]
MAPRRRYRGVPGARRHAASLAQVLTPEVSKVGGAAAGRRPHPQKSGGVDWFGYYTLSPSSTVRLGGLGSAEDGMPSYGGETGTSRRRSTVPYPEDEARLLILSGRKCDHLRREACTEKCRGGCGMERSLTRHVLWEWGLEGRATQSARKAGCHRRRDACCETITPAGRAVVAKLRTPPSDEDKSTTTQINAGEMEAGNRGHGGSERVSPTVPCALVKYHRAFHSAGQGPKEKHSPKIPAQLILSKPKDE